MGKTYYEKWIQLISAAAKSKDKDCKLDLLTGDADMLLELNSIICNSSPAKQMMMTEQDRQKLNKELETAKAQATKALIEINKISEEVGEEPFSPIEEDGSNVVEILGEFIRDFFVLSK